MKTPLFYIVKTITLTYAYLTCRSVLQPERRGPCRPLPRSQRQMRDSQGNAFPFLKRSVRWFGLLLRPLRLKYPLSLSYSFKLPLFFQYFYVVCLTLRETIRSRSFENIHVQFWAGKSPKTPLVHPLPFPPV